MATFVEMITNEIVLSFAIAVLLTQLIKMMVEWKKSGKADIKHMWETGGMPSSHSAAVSALIISVFFVEGFNTLFLITLAFGLIVIRDAFGIRHQAGEQARTINKIIHDLKLEKRFMTKRLKELLGHSTTQVQAGILIGVAVSLGIHYLV